MSPLRAPTVGGLAGGVGATTVARALHAREIGPVGGAGRLPDVVVCRATVSGLALAERPVPTRQVGPPVLAVSAGSGGPDGVVADRLADVAAGWSGPVVLPHVGHWALVDDPYAEAAELLRRADPPEELGRYAEALARIVALLTAGERLEGPEDCCSGVLRPVRGIRVGLPAEPVPTWAGAVASAPAGTAW